MLYCNKDLIGRSLSALDGDVGEIVDVYFDDADWTVRYLVVDTGNWLDSRKVLISPATLAPAQAEGGAVRAELSRQQVQGSPMIDTHAPVSRQQEVLHADYYGYSAYWAGAGLWGMGALPIADPMIDARRVATLAEHSEAPAGNAADTHLRSCAEVSGYHIRAEDGEIGHVEDFAIDPQSWRIRALLIDTRNWLPGKHVQVEPGVIGSVDWAERSVTVALSRDAVKQSPTAGGG